MEVKLEVKMDITPPKIFHFSQFTFLPFYFFTLLPFFKFTFCKNTKDLEIIQLLT